MSLDPLLHSSPVIQIHALFAFLALLLGAVQLFRKKGDTVHRALGRTWVGLMANASAKSPNPTTIRVIGFARSSTTDLPTETERSFEESWVEGPTGCRIGCGTGGGG